MTDVQEWVASIVLQEVLDVAGPLRHDIVQLVEKNTRSTGAYFNDVTKKGVQEQRTHKPRIYGTVPDRALEEFVGTYRDQANVYKIVVVLEGGQLFWMKQGLESEKFPLKYVGIDSLTWLQPWNELARRGRYVGEAGSHYCLDFTFSTDEDGRAMAYCSWAYDYPNYIHFMRVEQGQPERAFVAVRPPWWTLEYQRRWSAVGG